MISLDTGRHVLPFSNEFAFSIQSFPKGHSAFCSAIYFKNRESVDEIPIFVSDRTCTEAVTYMTDLNGGLMVTGDLRVNGLLALLVFTIILSGRHP